MQAHTHNKKKGQIHGTHIWDSHFTLGYIIQLISTLQLQLADVGTVYLNSEHRKKAPSLNHTPIHLCHIFRPRRDCWSNRRGQTSSIIICRNVTPRRASSCCIAPLLLGSGRLQPHPKLVIIDGRTRVHEGWRSVWGLCQSRTRRRQGSGVELERRRVLDDAP